MDHMEPYHQGDRYLLLEKGSEEWSNGKGTVNDTTGALGKTVGQLYSQGKVSLSGCELLYHCHRFSFTCNYDSEN